MKATSERILEQMLGAKLVAVVRLNDPDTGLRVAKALREGGVRLIEIALTTPSGIDLIREITTALPDAVVGAGTVMTVEEVDRCVEAGAAFGVSPILDARIVRRAQEAGFLFSPGAYTPTEVHQAWQMGAPIVKIFPAARVGPQYIKDLKAPMPFLRLMPTGGVDDRTISEFLAAGADVVGAGSWLIDDGAVRRGEYDVIADKARRLVRAIRDHA